MDSGPRCKHSQRIASCIDNIRTRFVAPATYVDARAKRTRIAALRRQFLVRQGGCRLSPHTQSGRRSSFSRACAGVQSPTHALPTGPTRCSPTSQVVAQAWGATRTRGMATLQPGKLLGCIAFAAPLPHANTGIDASRWPVRGTQRPSRWQRGLGPGRLSERENRAGTPARVRPSQS